MSVITTINDFQNSFTPSEKKIADYLLMYPNRLLKISAENLSQETGVSIAGITRFSQKIGYSGFKELKFSISKDVLSLNTAPTDQTIIETITSIYADYILKFKEYISVHDLQKAAELIESSKKVKIWGISRSSLSAQQLSYRLMRVFVDSQVFIDTISMSWNLELTTSDDLVILISPSMNEIYSELINEYREKKVKILLLTMNPAFEKEDFDLVIRLPWISNDSTSTFLDDQALMQIFFEILVSQIAKLTS